MASRRRRPVTAALSVQIEAAAVPLGVALAVGGEPVTLDRYFPAASISGMLAPRVDIETGKRLPPRTAARTDGLRSREAKIKPGGLRTDGGELPDKRGEAKR